jgi:hypothetical protein
MTEHNPYILRIELEDFENETRYAEYQSFTVADAESKYRLDITYLSACPKAGPGFPTSHVVVFYIFND